MKIGWRKIKFHGMRKFLPWILIAAIMLMTSHLGAAPPVVLVHADSSAFQILEDSILTFLYGKVHFKQGDAEIYADSVTYSSKGYYRFMGEVRFLDTTRSISAQQLTYAQHENIFQAAGSARLIDRQKHIQVAGDNIQFDNDTKILTVSKAPYLVFNYDDLTRMIEVTSDSLRYFSKENYAEAMGNVVITKANLSANCGKARLEPDSNRLFLSEAPKAEQLENAIYGDSMAVFLTNDLIDHIDVAGDAKAIYKQKNAPEDSLFTESRLKAKEIRFFFIDEILTSIVSAGNSYSEYLPIQGDSISAGRNLASGDSIKLYFDQRRLKEVEIITSCEGQYFSSTKKDSMGQIVSEDTINYKSDRLKYLIGQHSIDLYKSAQVRHQNVTLEADSVQFNTETKILRAASYWSPADNGDSLYHPVMLKDEKDIIYGERLAYNVETRKGKIKRSDTQIESAYYHGNVLRKEEDNVLMVNGGRYTTCDLKEPHFQFYSRAMKLITNDRVIARPVVLYIDKIPIFYLPYFVFSIKKGRHSGFLPFQFGNFARGTRFVNHLGYYWALSDYYDLETSINYNDQVGVTFNLATRYALRYKYSGSLTGSYAHETDHTILGEQKRNRWNLSLNHDHTISETAKLSGSGDFVSDASYFTDNSTNPDERLRRILRSQLNFSKRWGALSFYAVTEGTKNLDDKTTTYSLPRLSFSVPSKQIFPAAKEADKKWYQNLYLSYRVDANNYISNFMLAGSMTRRHYMTATHAAQASLPTKFLSYLTVQPSLNVNEYWFYIFDNGEVRDQGLSAGTPLRRLDYDFGLGANTHLYGLFRPPIPGLIGIRHVIYPTLSFSYHPKSERHAEEASFIGLGGSSSESQTLGWSVNSLFQIKYKKGEQEKKMDLFNLNFSSGYNFKSRGYKWSYLNTTFNSSSIPHLNFSATAVHDLYNRQTGKLDILGAHLINLSFSTNFSYSGQAGFSSATQSADSQTIPTSAGNRPYPWSISIGHRYAESQLSGLKSITHWLTLNSEFNLTQNWNVSFSQNYDIKRKEITERVFSFHRDLHCWEAIFYWIPEGSRKGYYFKISVKQLPDIKFESSQSGLRGALFDQFPY